MSYNYSLVVDADGQSVLTIYRDGEHSVVNQDHPNFSRLVQAALENEDPTPWLNIESRITAIDDRVCIKDGVVYFDEEPVHNLLTETILRYSREGREATGLVKFMENLQENPSRRAREQLFEWLERQGLTCTLDGHFIGYKGVQADGTSSFSGPGIVNGVPMNGHLPNEVGNVIEMVRSSVMDDPDIDCSHGLHVGSYGYASHFGCRLLVVKVNPKDVVSVPRHDTNKLRCCRYEVLELHEPKYDDVSKYEAEGDWDDDDDFEEEGLFEDLEERGLPAGWLDKLRNRFRH